MRQRRPRIIEIIAAGFVVFMTGWRLTALAWAQTRPDGKTLFEKRCGGCHALDRDKEGPRLGGVYGRGAGKIESFQYSEALKKSNIQWTEETLDKWLTDTEKLVPDNDMTFYVDKPDERREIIAFLKRSGK